MRHSARSILTRLGVVLLLLQTMGTAGAAPVTPRSPGQDRYGDPLPEHAVARLGTVRLRHSDTVNSLAFSPDGKVLASAGDDRVVILWDVATGKELRTLRHSATVQAVLFTPDGKTLISIHHHPIQPHPDGDRIHLWEVETGKEVRSLELPESHAGAQMVLSRDGKTLFTTMIGPIVALDVATGRQVWGDDWHAGCKCLALSPDGKTLATGSDMGHLSLRDVKTGELLRDLPAAHDDENFGPILALSFSPDGRTLAFTEAHGGLTLWDVSAEKFIRRSKVTSGILAPLAFSPDGKKLACGIAQVLSLYDPTSGQEAARLERHQSWIRSIVFSSDGRYLASAGQDRTIRIWNAATLKPLHRFADDPGGSCKVSFQRDGNRLLTSNWSSGQASDHGTSYVTWTDGTDTCTRRLWEAGSAKSLRESPPEYAGSGEGCLSPDGNLFACPDKDGLVRLVDVKSGKLLRRVGKKGDAFTAKAVAFTRDGRLVAVVSNELGRVVTSHGERDDRLRLWEVATGRLFGPPPDYSLSSTVVTALLASATGKLVLIPTDTPGMDRLSGVQLSPRGRILAASNWGWEPHSSIHLWSLNRGRGLRPIVLPEPLEELSPVVAADESLVITREYLSAGDYRDGTKPKQTIRVREMLSGKVVLCLPDQSDVSCYALSRDNRFLALGDDDGSIRLLEVVSGRQVQRLRGHRGGIASLEFSPNGAFLVSGSDDTTAIVWDFRKLSPVENANPAERLGDTLWADLASADARKVLRAEQVLRANPDKAVAMLKAHLRATPELDAAAAEKMIADLDSDDFQVREQATNGLRSLERTAILLLNKARQATRSAEARSRLDRLLIDADDPHNAPEQLRNLRAVHCLGVLNTESARQLLQALAKGAAEARLTQKAREELEWLEYERGK